jgi:hypothetical protein
LIEERNDRKRRKECLLSKVRISSLAAIMSANVVLILVVTVWILSYHSSEDGWILRTNLNIVKVRVTDGESLIESKRNVGSCFKIDVSDHQLSKCSVFKVEVVCDEVVDVLLIHPCCIASYHPIWSPHWELVITAFIFLEDE